MPGDKKVVRRPGKSCILLVIFSVALVATYYLTLSNHLGDQAAIADQLSRDSYQRVNSLMTSMTAYSTTVGNRSQTFVKTVECSQLDPSWLETQLKPVELKVPLFLEEFKNPCWKIADVNRTSTEEIRCLPYYYIIGTSKCGTTDLSYTLGTHPNVTFGSLKDYWWWNLKQVGLRQTGGGVTTRFKSGPQSLTNYANCFNKAAAQIQKKTIDGMHYMVTVDGTSSTMWNTDGWPGFPDNRNLSQPRITTAHYLRAVQPDAKLIAILRNPTDRLYSDYQCLKRAYDKNTITNPEHFHVVASKAVRIMKECIVSRGARECVYDPCLHRKMPVRLRIGLYYIYLEDWMKVFKRDQFRIIQTEEYAKGRASIIEDLSTFLQIGPLPKRLKDEMNARKVANARKPGRAKQGDMLPKTRKLLEDFHRPFNKKLADLLEDDKFLWQ